MGDPAELAFGHALAMLGDPEAAADVANTALRRAGRNRGSVLAHARALSVARAAEDEPVDIAGLHLVVLDLPALAATLASTRPPDERAALDVRARTTGDLAALGEALGQRPTAAAQRCQAIADEWERTLDPALLAFSGPGDCADLAAILADAEPRTVADLLGVATAVHAHVPNCTLCSDRMRAMSPVRSFFSGGTVEVPNAVREVGHLSRRRRPAADPPPLFEADEPRGTRPALLVLVALVVAVLVAGVVVVLAHRHAASGVTALTHMPARNALTLSDPEVADGVAHLHLSNPTDHPVGYRAATSAEWAQVTPRTGRIAAHDAALLTITTLDSAPEGTPTATLTVTTSTGGALSRDITWSIEQPPQIDANAQGCEIDVQVVDAGQVTSVVLHWRDATDHDQTLTAAADGYHAQLAPEAQPITWSVTAVDDRGNTAQTPGQMIQPGAC